MSDKKVLLIGSSSEDTKKVSKDIEEELKLPVTLVGNVPDAIQKLMVNPYSLVVFTVDEFDQDLFDLVTSARDLSSDFPLILITKVMQKDSSKIIAKIKKTVLLQDPYNKTEFRGVMNKMITGDTVKQRLQKRFITNQDGLVSLKKHKLTCIIKNLSSQGAYVELKSDLEKDILKVGDNATLLLSLDEPGRSHEITVRVIWCKITPEGSLGAGLSFQKKSSSNT